MIAKYKLKVIPRECFIFIFINNIKYFRYNLKMPYLGITFPKKFGVVLLFQDDDDDVLLSEEDFKDLLKKINDRERKKLIKRLMVTNSELLEICQELQEFLEDNNFTAEDFFYWREVKERRQLH